MKNQECCICKRECESIYGNNAQPINNGRCCDVCNDTKVIPARIELWLKDRNKDMKISPQQQRRNQVIAKGNKWATENWNATHNESLKI